MSVAKALPIHRVFNVAYNGIARELVSEAVLVDPLTNKNLVLPRVVWDTGATNSVISLANAKALGLTPTGIIQVRTASGVTTANTYVVHIGLTHSKVMIREVNIADGDIDCDMLIGMDVIGAGDFFVQNCGGKTHFSFCLPAFENKFDAIEKANKVNERNQKINFKAGHR